MYTQARQPMLASAVALAMTAFAGPIAAGTVAQDVTEARQEAQIWTTYALSPYLRANDLRVSVRGGKATLTGTVEEGVNRDLAKQIALGVAGVKEVDNQIVVQADYTPPPRSTDRSYGELIDDASITAAVKSKLMWSKHTDGLTTEVDTRMGSVTLTGTADSAAAKGAAGRLARSTLGVNSVDNRLVVSRTKQSPPSTIKGSAHEAGKGISDSWITAKVKSTFMYSSNVAGSDIAVSTEDGVVTLTGKVDSGAERALAIELAQNVRGVKSVRSKRLTF